MFIEDLTIKGYGRLKDFSVQPGRGLNVVYGSNETGKSTLGNCIRDLLLGPGRWEGELHGPRAPEARPSDGGRFAARLRYRVESGTVYMLQRDFEMGACRIRDDSSATEVPVAEDVPTAPGVVFPQLEETVTVALPPPPPPPPVPPAEGRPSAARARLADLEAERSRWSYLYHQVQVERLGSVLERLTQIETDISALEPQLAELQQQADGEATRPRTIPIKHQAKVDALESEIMVLRKNADTLIEKRKAVTAQLASFEKYFNITPEQLEQLHALEKTDLSGVDEKRRNMEGFRFKEADISRRLGELRGCFDDFSTEEAFELRISELEKGIARNEQLGTKISEQQRLQTDAEHQQQAGKTHIIIGAVGVAIALLPFLMPGLSTDLKLYGTLPFGFLVAVGGFGLKAYEQAKAGRLLGEANALSSDLERLRGDVAQAREQLKVIMDRARVTTLKDLRSQFREYLGMQRDLTTVREYIEEFESNIEDMSSQSPLETPRALIETGLLKASEPVTSRVLTAFFENYGMFEKFRKEDNELKNKALEVSGEIDKKRAQQEKLADSGSAEPASSGAGEACRKLNEQIDGLRKRMVTLCQGATPQAVRADFEAAQAEVARLDALDAAYGKLKVDAHAMPEYRERLHELDDKLAKARSEVAAVPETVAPPAAPRDTTPAATSVNEPARNIAARRIQVEFAYLTGQEISVRLDVVEARVDMRISRDAGSIWAAPITLGRAEAELLDGLLAAELGRSPLGGNMPIILDNPFAELDAARLKRACEWLVELSSEAQVFYLTSEASAVRGMLIERKIDFKEQSSGDLKVITCEPPAGAGATGQTSAA